MATTTKQLKFTTEQMQLFENDANNGNVDAQVKLGVIYSHSLYKKPDLKNSYEWLELAANAGNVIAQSHLAQLYYTKKGIFNDYEKAFNWAQAAANKGDRDAESLLGQMYAEGKHVSRSFHKAASYLKKASYKGCPIAMLDLGGLYLYGQGVKQDNARAYCWWSLAYDCGNKLALDAMITGGRDMKDSDFDNAEAVIEEVVSKLKPEPHWADTIFEEYVSRNKPTLLNRLINNVLKTKDKEANKNSSLASDL